MNAVESNRTTCMKRILCLFYALLITSTAPVYAATHTWTGGNTSGLWSVPSNWEGGSPPFANENPLHLIFPTDAVRRLSTNNIANLNIDSLTIAGAAYTIAATGSGTNMGFNSSVGTLYWNIQVTSGTGHSIQRSINFALDGTLEMTIATNSSLEIRAPLGAAANNSGLFKDGPGTVYLNPTTDNTYDGVTTVQNGSLILQGSHVELGFNVGDVTVPGPLIIGNNSPSAHATCLVDFAGQIADNAAVTVNRNGELIFADVNDTIGSLTLVGGIVDTSNGKLTLNGNVLVQTPPSGTASQFHGHLALGNIGRFFTVEDPDGYFAMYGVISGGNFGNVPAGILKNGPGWMSLASSSNTFGGDIYVSAGTLSFSNSKQLGAPTNSVGVASNATLVLGGINFGPVVNNKELSLAGGARVEAALDSEWDGPVVLHGQAIVHVPDTNILFALNGPVTGVGGFTKTGKGTLQFASTAPNSFTGVAHIQEGEVELWNAFINPFLAITGPLIIGDDDTNHAATVRFLAHEQIATNVPVVIRDNGKLLLENKQQTFGALVMRGGLLDSGPLGMVRLAGNVLATNVGGYKYPVIRGRMDLGNEPRTFFIRGEQFYLQAVVSGGTNADLIKAGAQTMYLEGSNTYAGLTLVEAGTLIVDNTLSLGSTERGTRVLDGGGLRLVGVAKPLSIAGEALRLSGDGASSLDPGALAAMGTNTWEGPIELDDAAHVYVYGVPSSRLIIAGTVSGPGGLTKAGPGPLFLAGAGLFPPENTYDGTTHVLDGKLVLIKDLVFPAPSIPGHLVIGGGADGTHPVVSVQGRNQFAGNGMVTVASNAELRVEGPYIGIIGSLAGAGLVDLAPGSRLITGMNNADSQFSGTLQGGSMNETNLVKAGDGTFALAGTNTLAGRTEVSDGILRINSQQPAARFQVSGQGVLGGVGRAGAVTAFRGTVAPGAHIGVLRLASLSTVESNVVQVQIGGPILGTGYDQLELDAAPDLTLTQLACILSGGFNPTLGQEFMILRNNSGSPITGHFASLPEDTLMYAGPHQMKITYLGGDGNDVVLKVIAKAGSISGITYDGGNRVTVSGTGTPGANYTVEANTNLNNSLGWASIGNIVADPNGLLEIVVGDVPNYSQRFFRFVLP
jgi:fibronectin-binding autotransporter adhesin